MGKYQLHKLLFPQLILIFEICDKGPKIWCLQKYIQGIKHGGKIEQHVMMADITWKTKRVRWNHVIVRMWELRKMIIDNWRQRHKLQMKHLLRRSKKNFLTCLFPVQSHLKNKKKRKAVKRSQLFRGRLAWCMKRKYRKRWNFSNKTMTTFFFLKCKLQIKPQIRTGK